MKYIKIYALAVSTYGCYKRYYNGFESYYVIIFYGLGVLLPIVNIGLVGVRNDHCHLYENPIIVEYYFPGFDPDFIGMD